MLVSGPDSYPKDPSPGPPWQGVGPSITRAGFIYKVAKVMPFGRVSETKKVEIPVEDLRHRSTLPCCRCGHTQGVLAVFTLLGVFCILLLGCFSELDQLNFLWVLVWVVDRLLDQLPTEVEEPYIGP